MLQRDSLKKVLVLGLFLLVGITSRLLPHPPNFTAVSALLIISSIALNRRYAMLIPLIVMFVTDLILGVHGVMLFTWGAFAVIGFVSYLALKDNVSLTRVVATSLFASVFFYLISNFGVWAEGFLYPPTLSGLLQSYYMAIPFFRNTILGDLFYTGVFYGVYALVIQGKSVLSHSLSRN